LNNKMAAKKDVKTGDTPYKLMFKAAETNKLK
jgi:hypothetical protein